jgi:hypothetical protein
LIELAAEAASGAFGRPLCPEAKKSGHIQPGNRTENPFEEYRSFSGDHTSMRAQIPALKTMALIFSVMAAIAGCASLSPQPEDARNAEARAGAQIVIAYLNSQNDDLIHYKGIGNIKVRQNQITLIDERVAWVASETAKLNLVIMVSGHPAVKMASDGKWFYYYEARRGRPMYKKVPASDSNLKRITGMPIETADIIHLLAGRVPLREHHSARLERSNAGQGYVLVLKRRWWGVAEKVFLDESRTRVDRIEFYSRSGELTYRARFDAMQTIGGYRVPASLSITDGDGLDFQLVVNRYWADVDVSPSMFVLKPPE